MRSWESRLDLPSFDFAPYAGVAEQVREHGVVIRTYAELADDPDRHRKLYELTTELDRDVPSPDPPTAVDYDLWLDRLLSSPDLLPDGWFIAVHDGEYVGYNQLWSSQGGDMLYNGLTGVKRSFRRKGIALALKLRGIAWAKEAGRPEIRTWNASNNAAMLSINVRLGFVKQPAWIVYEKNLAAD